MFNLWDRVKLKDCGHELIGKIVQIIPELEPVYLVDCGTNGKYYRAEGLLELIKESEEKKTMNENYIMLNGKRIDLTDEQLIKLGIKTKSKDPFTRITSQTYYCIDCTANLMPMTEENEIFDNTCYTIANYCTDEKLMKQRALHETLDRLLWRFSMQNDGDKIDWYIRGKKKYYVVYDYNSKDFKIDAFECLYGCTLKQSTEYFYSAGIAQRAIDEIIKPFMEAHPEFVW